MTVWLVPDTNFFLHFTSIDEIDWSRVCPADSFVVVISSTVLDELDKHKYSEKERVQSRAKKTVERLIELNSGGGMFRNGSRLELSLERIATLPFAEMDLDQENNDDQILALVAHLAKVHKGVGEKVVFVTGDGLAFLKAQARSIESVRLTDEFRLRIAEHPAEAENKDLKKRIRKIESRLPDLQLVGDARDKRILLSPTVTTDFQYSSLSDEMLKERANHPLMELIAPEVTSTESVDSSGKSIKGIRITGKLGGQPSNRSREEYNRNLENYFDDFEKYLKQGRLREDLVNRSVNLELNIANSGSSPASDVVVRIKCSKGLRLKRTSDLPEIGDRPPVPQRPEASDIFELMKSIASFGQTKTIGADLGLFHHQMISKNSERPNIGIWKLSDLNNEALLEIGKARQGETLSLDKLTVIFPKDERPRSLSLDVIITADELPEAIEDRFSIIVASDRK